MTDVDMDAGKDGEHELRGTRSERGPSHSSEIAELDCRGQRCPLPVITMAKRLTELPVGARLRVLADDPAAATDIPAWCRMRGHEYLGTSGGDADAYLVRRSH
jgi:tRNA 2-thiouridine synthesizing protein A